MKGILGLTFAGLGGAAVAVLALALAEVVTRIFTHQKLDFPGRNVREKLKHLVH